MNDIKNPETILEHVKDEVLSLQEKQALFRKITEHTSDESEKSALSRALSKRGISIFSLPMNYYNPLFLKTGAAVVLFSTLTTTAFASQSSKPGDILFPLDRALEEIRVSLAQGDKKTELKIAQAEERLLEIRTLMEKDDSSAGSVSSTILTIEADVFSDITLVKIEHNDTKTYIETPLKDEGALSALIAERLGIDTEEVRRVLRIEIEDRSSRPDDRDVPGTSSSRRDTNILVGTNLLEEHLRVVLAATEGGETITRTRIEGLVQELNTLLSTQEGDDILSISDDTTGVTLVRNERPSSLSLEIEVDVFTDRTLIKIEENDRKTYLETTLTGRDEIAGFIAERLGKELSEIVAVLDFEIEDRASRPRDGEDGDDSQDDNESDSDDDLRDDSTSSDSRGKDSDSDEDSSSDDDSSSEDSSSSASKIEVDIQEGRAYVKLEIGDLKDEYSIDSTDREAIINALAERHNLDRTFVEATLDLEFDD